MYMYVLGTFEDESDVLVLLGLGYNLISHRRLGLRLRVVHVSFIRPRGQRHAEHEWLEEILTSLKHGMKQIQTYATTTQFSECH